MHTFYSLQFCSCDLFCCFCQSTTKHSGLLVGSQLVLLASLACMLLFPVLYSHLLQDCMHVSPYALVFIFSCEVSGFFSCACVMSFMHLLVCFECLINMVYVRLLEA